MQSSATFSIAAAADMYPKSLSLNQAAGGHKNTCNDGTGYHTRNICSHSNRQDHSKRIFFLCRVLCEFGRGRYAGHTRNADRRVKVLSAPLMEIIHHPSADQSANRGKCRARMPSTRIVRTVGFKIVDASQSVPSKSPKKNVAK